MKAHRYFLLSSLVRMKEHPKLHLISTATVTLCFFLVGLGLMFFYQLQESIEQTGKQQWVYVYVGDQADVLPKIRKNHCQVNWVEQCIAVTKEAAKEKFIERYPDMAASMRTLDSNPLPASMEIQLASNIDDSLALEGWLAGLRKDPLVQDVNDGGQWLGQWISLVQLFDTLTYALAALVGLMIVGMIANTITLLMYSKKDEIEIMQLVGATPWMIQLPLMLSGGLYGLVGAMLSLVCLYGSYTWLVSFLTQKYPALLSSRVEFMSFFDQALLVMLAVVVSLLGSWLASKRFLYRKKSQT
jgi:cell division transport system permease protein